METTAASSVRELDSPREVLAFARDRRAVADRAEAELLQAAVAWADQHPAESLEACEVFRAPGYWGGAGDSAVPIAGPGAPLVAEFSVAEFAAAVGMTTDAGKCYLGQALELRYRLPRLWRRVVSGELAGWKARRVAHETISHVLTGAAAAYVDRHVAPVAHKIGARAIDRLVTEGIARHMPATAEDARRAAADGRHFDVDHHQVTWAGTSLLHGEVDLADALDLDAAVAHRAGQLKELGCTESLDVRRSPALGEIARHQLALDLTTFPDAVPAQPRRRASRPVVLYVHLHQSAIEGTGSTGCGVGRVENTHHPVTAEQIRTWCGHPDAQVTVKPVIDLADQSTSSNTRSPTGSPRPSPSETTPACSPGAPAPPEGSAPMSTAATATTTSRTPRAGRPAPASSHHCAGDITGSRPTAAGPTPSSTPAPTSGRPRTATTTCATTPAPSTSATTDAHHHPTSSHPAPTRLNPRQAGYRHASALKGLRSRHAWECDTFSLRASGSRLVRMATPAR